jgi:hypothetical protein
MSRGIFKKDPSGNFYLSSLELRFIKQMVAFQFRDEACCYVEKNPGKLVLDILDFES